MSAATENIVISFPEGYDARREYETPMPGYLSDVVVQLEAGKRYKLFFIDPVRLQQTLEDEIKSGREFYAEPGLIVMPEVTKDAIVKTVNRLVQQGFFKYLQPL